MTRIYGRGSLLGLLAPLLAYIMAAAGMRGWEEVARRQMEDDANRMARLGYRIETTEEVRLAAFGIVYYRVTYRRSEG